MRFVPLSVALAEAAPIPADAHGILPLEAFRHRVEQLYIRIAGSLTDGMALWIDLRWQGERIAFGDGDRADAGLETLVRIDGQIIGTVGLQHGGPAAEALLDLVLLSIENAARAHLAASHARQSERRFRATFDQAPVGIAHVALDGRFLMVNDHFCTIAGHSRDALMLHGFQKRGRNGHLSD